MSTHATSFTCYFRSEILKICVTQLLIRISSRITIILMTAASLLTVGIILIDLWTILIVWQDWIYAIIMALVN